MPQAAVIDDKYGLEPAPVPIGVTDDKYGLEPAQKQSESTAEPNLPGATPRLVAAVKNSANPKVAEMSKPSRFEESNPVIPKNYGFTAGNLAGNAWRGLKELGGAAYDTGKDLLFSEGKNAAGEEEHGIGGLVGMNAEGEFDPLGRASHLAHKYILDPGKAQADKAKQDMATGNVGAAVGHTIASAVPVAGPWAADLAEQAGSGDIGGTIARGGIQVLAEEAVKPLSKVAARTAGDVRERVGGAIHDPKTGAMTKGAEGMSRATGAVVGGTTGGFIGSIAGPTGTYAGTATGGTAGTIAGPALMERMFPEPASRVAARDQFLKDKAITEAQEGAAKEDVSRTKEQARIDAENESRLREIEEARQKELADQEKLKEQHAESLVRRGREQDILDRKASANTPEVGPIGSVALPTTFRGGSTLSSAPSAHPPLPEVKPMQPPTQFPRVQTKAEVAASKNAETSKNGPIIPGGKIVGPEADPLPVKTTYQSYTREDLVRMARSGNRDAFLKLVRSPAGTDLSQFKYQYGYGVEGTPIYKEKPFRNYDDRGNLEPKPGARPASIVGTPRMVQAVAKQGEIPKVAAGGTTAPLNFDRSIKVPSEGPVLLKPEAPAAEPAERSPAPTGKPPEGTPERRSGAGNYTGPERRGVYDIHKENVGPTEGEKLEKDMRAARAGTPSTVTEGEALQRIMRDPQKYADYQAADQRTRDKMLVMMKNVLSQRNELIKPMVKPIPEGVLPGMAEHVEKQAEGAARVKGEDLTAQIRQPRDINAAAGEMETRSPLFRGTDASPQRELLQPMEKPVETAPEREPGDEPEEEAEPVEIKGVTEPVKTKTAKAKQVPVEKRYSREEIIDAEGRIQQELGMVQAADRPGRYYDENEMGEYNPQKEQSSSRGVTSGGKWRGVKSGRNMQPWMSTTDFTPAQIEKGLRNKDSAMYKRMIDSAIRFNRREKMTPEEIATEGQALADRLSSFFVKPKRTE